MAVYRVSSVSDIGSPSTFRTTVLEGPTQQSSATVTQNDMIYLDNNSTTPLDPAVVDAMLPYFTTKFGNPSNPAHDYGLEAARAVERARSQVAHLIGSEAKEILFTSGATESNNLAILGAARASRSRGNHVVTTVIEHKAVLNPCKQLEREGMTVTYLPVDRTGFVSAERLGGSPHRPHRPRECNGRKQRGRDTSADPGDRMPLQGTWDPVPQRCRTGTWKDSVRCGRTRRRPAQHIRAQNVWPEGGRGSLRSQSKSRRST